jgi:2-oxoglutarate dehydrogenase E2 component (dihydrolipoamide succinyltransferase)
MALVDLVMPKLGESIMEATILKWFKQPGDTIKQDETLLEIATDKVDSEVPSTAEGVVEEILFKVNDIVPIGSVIAKIRTSIAEPVDIPAKPAVIDPEQMASYDSREETRHQPVSNPTNGQSAAGGRQERGSAEPATVSGNRFYSPLVLNIAANEGISLSELETIRGTGNEGRVTKKDILQWVSGKKSRAGGYQAVGDSEQPEEPVYQQPMGNAPSYSGYKASGNFDAAGGNVEIIEMDRMRRLIAEHMVRSKHTSPHVTSFTEADVTSLVMWREKAKKEFEKREGTKLTYTPLFIEAIARCLRKYPLVNCSVEGNQIILKKDINIGMATALPNGNLIVPVIRNADQFNLVGLAKQVNNLADNARNNKLRPEDTQGGTFTMTNVGTFGSLMGTPIINQPQVAILAIGIIKKRPVVIETLQGDAIAIRHMMYLSLSYDHRIVDGSLGAGFLSDIAKELENFNPEREV